MLPLLDAQVRLVLLNHVAMRLAEAEPTELHAAGIDTEQLVSLREVNTLEHIASQATARHRFRAVLVGSFAALVLVLATIGVFGVLAYSVEQRRREYGLRMALGAPPSQVLWMLGRSVGRLLAAGVGIGLLAALALGRALDTLLFDVDPGQLGATQVLQTWFEGRCVHGATA